MEQPGIKSREVDEKLQKVEWGWMRWMGSHRKKKGECGGWGCCREETTLHLATKWYRCQERHRTHAHIHYHSHYTEFNPPFLFRHRIPPYLVNLKMTRQYLRSPDRSKWFRVWQRARVIQRSPSDYRVQETRLRYSPGGYFSHLMTTPLPLNPRKHPNRKFLGPGIYRPPPGIENSEQTFHAGFFSMQLHKHTWCHPRRWHRLLELWRTLMIR